MKQVSILIFVLLVTLTGCGILYQKGHERTPCDHPRLVELRAKSSEELTSRERQEYDSLDYFCLKYQAENPASTGGGGFLFLMLGVIAIVIGIVVSTF